jgi:hypothetical protein
MCNVIMVLCSSTTEKSWDKKSRDFGFYPIKYSNTWKPNNTLLKNEWVNEVIRE